jgi:hypothetical protein
MFEVPGLVELEGFTPHSNSLECLYSFDAIVRDKNSKVTTGFVAFSVLFLSFLHTLFSLPFPGKKHANVGDGDSHSRGLEFSTPVA